MNRPPSKQPLPPHAIKVFTGILFDVYQWEQVLFDGTSATFEKITKRDTVNIVAVTDENRILLTRQKQPGMQPFVGLPGGQLDPGETPLQAASRELLEETGYCSTAWNEWDALQPFSKIDWAAYTYIAKGSRKTSELHLDGGEQIEVFDVSFEEFLSHITRDDFRDSEVALRILRAKEQGKLEAFRSLLGI